MKKIENCKLEKQLMVHKFSNGIILPQKQEKGAPMWGLGGVCDEQEKFVQASFYDGGWAKQGGKYNWEDEKYENFPVVYVGLFYSHWGHFLIDLTNRYWALQELRNQVPELRIAYIGEEEIKGNNLQFLKFLGISKEQIYQVKQPTRFSEVYVPEQAFKSCDWYTKEHIRMFDCVVDKALNSGDKFIKLQGIKKVYLTRRGFGKAVSTEFGEDYFEQCFRKNGFDVISPEKLSLSEQIYLWNHAEQIVCMNGSIPLNVVFCKNPKLKLTILNKTSIPHENPNILLNMRNVKAIFVDVYEEPVKGYPKSLGEGPFLILPTSEFHQYCERQEFQLPMNDEEELRYCRKQKRMYYRYLFDVKRRLKILAYKIIYQYLKLR